MKIKICGLTTPADAYLANLYRPDMIGFVFYPPSKRFVSAGHARDLRRILSPEIAAVGVFVDEDTKRIKALYDSGIINAAQLHGAESPEDVARLKAAGVPVIKALRVACPEDVEQAKCYAPDAFLFDVRAESPGGTGKRFDWRLLSCYSGLVPVILAGGITTQNVQEALTQPVAALDVSSGAEGAHGKDPEKMKALIQAVHENR